MVLFAHGDAGYECLYAPCFASMMSTLKLGTLVTIGGGGGGGGDRRQAS
jgi:hypothetical protein